MIKYLMAGTLVALLSSASYAGYAAKTERETQAYSVECDIHTDAKKFALVHARRSILR